MIIKILISDILNGFDESDLVCIDNLDSIYGNIYGNIVYLFY